VFNIPLNIQNFGDKSLRLSTIIALTNNKMTKTFHQKTKYIVKIKAKKEMCPCNLPQVSVQWATGLPSVITGQGQCQSVLTICCVC